jgi:hypothetical protein
MKEVKEHYEAVYDKPFARNNFQKKILDLGVLERLEKKSQVLPIWLLIYIGFRNSFIPQAPPGVLANHTKDFVWDPS